MHRVGFTCAGNLCVIYTLHMTQPHFYPGMFQVLWLTSADIASTEAEAATEANVYAVVVDRPGNAPLSDESKAKFPVIEKLTDLP
jgi:hypothetical protein